MERPNALMLRRNNIRERNGVGIRLYHFLIYAKDAENERKRYANRYHWIKCVRII